ncbi:MAG TPA: FkbM family methyltransferase [Methylibium sp.]|uniref:FkbM family methyltransferase n=1 Tax=Methylibium sp. TaxID=2067992 RepID=UPI002DBF12B3|nr:FkbM family methyltransferase [Methylibium sp.]HEU4458439.1 FkbM family methyltransferase [Methylibium sp.]
MNAASASILAGGEPVYDLDLLRALRGTRIARELRVLSVIGAHRFDELPLIDKLFPALERIDLFEPQPGPLAALEALAARDARIRVFPFAVSDSDGTATFHVASNHGESSSLLALGTHKSLFPEVTMPDTIEVRTRRLDSVLAEHRLAAPDALLVDVQGAEYMVLSALPGELLAKLRLIYTEVSTEAVYEGARPLADVEALLAPRFVNAGFAPINARVPVHGNAVFVAREDLAALVELPLAERLRRGFHRWKRRRRALRQAHAA